MKKNILLIALLIFLFDNASAQDLSLSWAYGALTNDTTITVVGDTATLTSVGVYCKNNGTSLLSVKVRKKEISVVAGSQNYFCWGSCWASSVYTSPDSVDIAHDSMSYAFTGDYKAKDHMGITTIMYTFFDMFNPNDSVCVVVNYDCSMSAVGEIPSENIEFSNAFPNPANDHVAFNYSIPPSLNDCELIIRDLVGNIVSNILITDKTGTLKIYTDKLNNGVYFYSLLVNDKPSFTRKLIVRH